MKSAMIIPFIDAVLRKGKTLQIGRGFSIIALPDEHITGLAEHRELVANYESSLENMAAGLRLEPAAIQSQIGFTDAQKRSICIFTGMLIRLATGIPIDMPFWLETNEQNEARAYGQTLVRTYRNGPKYAYVLDEGLALSRIHNLSDRIDTLLNLFIKEKDKNRIIRAIEFVSIGFQTFHIPTRIVNQVTFLETLFTSSRNELTFQLSSRISWYLAAHSSAGNREEKFDLVRNIYDARSHVVHGEHTNNPTRNLRKWLDEAENLNTEIFNVMLKQNHIAAFSASETRRAKELKKLAIGIPCDFIVGGTSAG